MSTLFSQKMCPSACHCEKCFFSHRFTSFHNSNNLIGRANEPHFLSNVRVQCVAALYGKRFSVKFQIYILCMLICPFSPPFLIILCAKYTFLIGIRASIWCVVPTKSFFQPKTGERKRLEVVSYLAPAKCYVLQWISKLTTWDSLVLFFRVNVIWLGKWYWVEMESSQEKGSFYWEMRRRFYMAFDMV